jgi:hypothetical protein
MWTYIKNETVGSDTLLFFTKGAMERNTIVAGVATEVQIQELITQWEAEDAAVVTEEVL